MIKRPLVVMAITFISGIAAGRYAGFPWSVLPAILFFFLFIFLLLFYPEKIRQDLFLFSLPLLFWGGVISYEKQDSEPPVFYALGQETKKASVSGYVLECSVYDTYAKLIITDADIVVWKDTDSNPEYGDFAEGKAQFTENKILVYCSGDITASEGDLVLCVGELGRLRRAENPGQFDERSFYHARGIHVRMQADQLITKTKEAGKWLAVREKQKERMLQSFFRVLPEKEAEILGTMLLGRKDCLSQETREAYQGAGLSHLLSISGLHFSLFAMGCFRLLKRLRAGAVFSVLFSSGFVLFYGWLVGSGISVMRAAIMLVISFLAFFAGRSYDSPSALSAAACLILIMNPLLLFESSFLLSFGAVTGILLFYPMFQKNGMKLLGIPFSVQLVLLPVTLWFFYEVPVLSVVYNLLVLPFMGILLSLALLIGLLGIFWTSGARFLAGGAYYILKLYEAVCEINERLPGHTYVHGKPSVWNMILYFLLLFTLYMLLQKLPKKYMLCTLMLPAVVLLWGNHAQKVTFLSVGQGDCAVLQSGCQTVLVDAGGSVKNGAERILEPFLSYSGDTSVEYVFLSHADADHVCMLKELFNARLEKKTDVTIENLVVAYEEHREEKEEELLSLAKKAGTKIIEAKRGDRFLAGAYTIICLTPDGNETDNSGSSANERSLVLAAVNSEYSVLFTGDITEKKEREILAYLEATGLLSELGSRPMILKAAHHGSKYASSEDFLEGIKADCAVISCGANNRYGHPHEDTLLRLRRQKYDFFRTDLQGAVIAEKADHKLRIRTFLNSETE